MEIKIDANEYNALIIESEQLKKTLDQTKQMQARYAETLAETRKEQEEFLYKIAELAFSHKDCDEVSASLKVLVTGAGYCMWCGGIDCGGCE